VIVKVVITLIFLATAAGKLSGKMAPSWDKWGYSRLFMRATGAAELMALVLLWWPGLEFAGAAVLGAILVGALATLVRERESAGHIAFTAMTFVLVALQSYLSTVG
jgi:hypothetical protein